MLIENGELPEITVHGLRHSRSSLLLEARASIKEVQKRLGHTDVKMAMNIYTRHKNSQRAECSVAHEVHGNLDSFKKVGGMIIL